MSNYTAQSISVIISAYGDFWESSVFFTLASIKRQLYERARIQIILISRPEVWAEVRQQYPNWDILHIAVKTEGHYKNRYLAEAVKVATGDIVMLLDGDVIIPNYSMLHLDQILRLESKTCVVGFERHNITLDDINSYPTKHWHDLGFDEFLTAGMGEEALLNELISIHPFNACGFLIALKRDHISPSDFCQDYDGYWGEEDHDLAATLYKKGLNIKYYQKLPVLHWQHPKQPKVKLERQLNILFNNHGDLPFVNREMLVAGAANNYPFWCKGQSNKYQVVWHYLGGSKNSLALHVGSMIAAMDTVSILDGSPSPHFVHNLFDLSWQSYPNLIRESSLRSIERRQTINIYSEINEQPNQTKIYLGYNIAYLFLEGRLVSRSYMSYLSQYDELWVAGERQQKDLVLNGWHKPITIVENGIFPEIFFPQHRSDRKGNWQFLAVGVGHRKNNYKLIDIFARTFLADEPIELKLVVGHQTKELKKYVQQRWPDRAGQFRFVTESITSRQMATLYNQADALVSLSGGEAWNLPVMEAAACGLPVISPMGNGVDYLSEDNAIFIPSRPIIASALLAYAEPSYGQLAGVMKSFVNDRAFRWQAKQKALKLLNIVHRQYSWYAAARQAYRRLNEISDKL